MEVFVNFPSGEEECFEIPSDTNPNEMHKIIFDLALKKKIDNCDNMKKFLEIKEIDIHNYAIKYNQLALSLIKNSLFETENYQLSDTHTYNRPPNLDFLNSYGDIDLHKRYNNFKYLFIPGFLFKTLTKEELAATLETTLLFGNEADKKYFNFNFGREINLSNITATVSAIVNITNDYFFETLLEVCVRLDLCYEFLYHKAIDLKLRHYKLCKKYDIKLVIKRILYGENPETLKYISENFTFSNKGLMKNLDNACATFSKDEILSIPLFHKMIEEFDSSKILPLIKSFIIRNKSENIDLLKYLWSKVDNTSVTNKNNLLSETPRYFRYFHLKCAEILYDNTNDFDSFLIEKTKAVLNAKNINCFKSLIKYIINKKKFSNEQRIDIYIQTLNLKQVSFRRVILRSANFLPRDYLYNMLPYISEKDNKMVMKLLFNL